MTLCEVAIYTGREMVTLGQVVVNTGREIVKVYEVLFIQVGTY